MTISECLVQFGPTDLYVTRLCQGTAFRSMPREETKEGVRVLHHCLDRGVNFFDSAVAYGWGGSETLLGNAIAGLRDEVVVCTKIPSSQPPVEVGGSGEPQLFTNAYLSEQVEGSLGRLSTDRIDLLLLHQPDKGTLAEEIVGSMDGLVNEGKIRYWGVSNFRASEVRKLVQLSAGSTPMAGTEDYYTIAGEHQTPEGASRITQLEEEIFPVVREAGVGLLAFSPMDQGYLAPGRESQAGAALSGLIQVIDEVASGLGVERALVCVAWVLTRPEVTSVLAGSESPEHVDQNIAGTELELPEDALKVLNNASEEYRRRQLEEDE